MALLDIRKQFVKLSGRYDLVVDTSAWADNGANFYIQEGQKLLDQLTRVHEETAKVYLPLAIGGYYIKWDKTTRTIEDVWVNNNEERWQLEKITLNEFKAAYPELASSADTGTATYYAIAEVRALETTDQNSLGTFINFTHAETSTDYTEMAILIGPPTDEALVVELSGKFHQLVMTSDTDKNFWTERYPGLLLKAALYQHEVFSRGTENAKNWLNAISIEAAEIEKDFVTEEIYGLDAMEG